MKKLIAGLMCIFIGAQVAFAGEVPVGQEQIDNDTAVEQTAKNKDTEFKVSRSRFWLQTLAVTVAAGVIKNLIQRGIELGEPDYNTLVGTLFVALFSYVATLNNEILMWGRQNDAGLYGLSRFNPLKNIKIAFCEKA